MNQFRESLEFQNNLKIERLSNQINILLKTEKLKLQKTSSYLTEQALIARTLGIAKNSLEDIDLLNQDFSRMEFNINGPSMPDYLRGYEALEKEKSLLLERSDENILLLSSEYINLIDQYEKLNNDILQRPLSEIS